MLGNAVFSLSSTQAEEARILEEKNKHEQIQHFLTERATPDSIVPEKYSTSERPTWEPWILLYSREITGGAGVWRGVRGRDKPGITGGWDLAFGAWDWRPAATERGSGAESNYAVVASPAVAAWSGAAQARRGGLQGCAAVPHLTQLRWDRRVCA